MGRLRSLTTDEILIQLYYANKVCRVLDIYAVDNIVFMGMGEPADNAVSVTETVQVMADRQLFGLAASKITISTVAPTPESFLELGKAPALLAWSVHSTRDTLRRQLVPTTKNSMVELRDGLVEALLRRPKRMRTTMLEVVLIDHVNDDVDLDAAHLAEFVTQMRTDAEGSKILVNLIPFNDIGHGLYKKPSHDRVLAFQNALLAAGVKCYIRTTRGDDESAACGQLATKKMKPPQVALESK
jgi:23S rRNA (adenine2503-C2)-methyltransferase